MTPLLAIALSASVSLNPSAPKPNVLFIAVDDLKPMISCYGDREIKTPHLERLGAQGTVFLNAHCQQAVCGPSRASLLTGLRPDSTGVYDLKTRLRDLIPDVISLPQHFKQNGYTTLGMGKIFDPRSVDGAVKDDPASWSQPYLKVQENPESQMGFLNKEFVKRAREAKKTVAGGWDAVKDALGGFPPVEIDQDVPDEAYEDGLLARAGAEQITKLSRAAAPYFLAVGFKKPHLPFVAPKKYADLYRREAIALAPFQRMPVGAPSLAFQDSWELKNGSYAGLKNASGPLPEQTQRELIHGYMACVSYTDAQIGRLLDAVEASGEADNTIIVVWGDHGWHLGDHGMWCKHTNYESATRSPLIISAAGRNRSIGKSSSPVEFVDVYPTLCELAGLAAPSSLQGKSLLPVMANPKAKVKDFAVSQYPRVSSAGKELMGYAFRTERHRYVRWVPQNDIMEAPAAEELYDYSTDPHERVSLVSSPAAASVLATLRAKALEFLARQGPVPKSRKGSRFNSSSARER